MIGIRTAIAGSMGGGQSYDSDLVTYISGLATPLSDGQLTLLNTFILTLKSGLSITKLSDAFDCMYILANETAESSLRNLVKRAHDATAVNSPTFTALEGFTGNGASMYIDTNYKPSTQAVNYALNSASYGVYSRTDANNAGTIEIGTNAYCWGALRRGGLFYYGLNQNSYSNVAVSNSLGSFVSSRTASNLLTAIVNGIWIENETDESTGVPTANYYILAYNNGMSASAFSNYQISMAFMGRGLSTAEALVIHNAFEAYMDANGRGVI